MTITLNGSSLTIEKLVAIARDNEKVELAPEALERIKVCRAMLEEKAKITTGLHEVDINLKLTPGLPIMRRASVTLHRSNTSERRWRGVSMSMRMGIPVADPRSHSQ